MWGNKVECPNCHKIFYDMEEQEVICPNCHYQFANWIHHCHFNSVYDGGNYADLTSDTGDGFGDGDSWR